MAKNKGLTGKMITLMGRREPPQELIEKVLWGFVYPDLDQFVTEVEIARQVYRAYPDLVVAHEMPAHLQAVADSDHRAYRADDMAEMREQLMADPRLAKIVNEAREDADLSLIEHVARKLMREASAA